MDFDALYDEVFPSLFRYCQRLTGDPDVAEDMAQEAFVRMLERRVVGERAAVRVWLFKVATHLVRDRWKVSSNRKRLLESHPRHPWRRTGPRAGDGATGGRGQRTPRPGHAGSPRP